MSLIASLVLGAAFVLAGASKIAAGKAWPVQALDLGVPPAIALVVPWLELVVGAALLAQLVEPCTAVVAIVMLVAFTGLVAVRLAEGMRPVCACFGGWSAKPIGPATIARNAGLMVAGLLALYP